MAVSERRTLMGQGQIVRSSTNAPTADATWKPLYRVGAVAMFLLGLAWLMVTVTGGMIGTAPGNTTAYLSALGSHSGTAYFSYTVTGIADLLIIPAALALYFGFRKVSPTWMLLAMVVLVTCMAIDLATFVPTALALIALATATQTTAIVGAAHFGLATVPVYQFFGWVVPNLAFLPIAIAARRFGRFGKLTFVVGLAFVAFGIAGGVAFIYPSPGLAAYQLPGLFLEGVFWVMLGFLMLRVNRDAA